MKFDWRWCLRLYRADKKREGESAMAAPHTLDQIERANEALVAVAESQNLLSKVESMEGRVDAVHKSMTKLNERNGFAALILNSLKGGTL